MTTATSATLSTHLTQFPDVLEQLTAAHEAAWATVDPHILELCRLRIAGMLGAQAEQAINTPEAALTAEKRSALPQWPLSPLFTEAEKACLAFTEEFVIDVANLEEHTALRVGELLGQQELADFVSALLVVEQRIRISLAWQTLFGEDK